MEKIDWTKPVQPNNSDESKLREAIGGSLALSFEEWMLGQIVAGLCANPAFATDPKQFIDVTPDRAALLLEQLKKKF